MIFKVPSVFNILIQIAIKNPLRYELFFILQNNSECRSLGQRNKSLHLFLFYSRCKLFKDSDLLLDLYIPAQSLAYNECLFNK